jgi:hypothetical protein
LYPLTVHQDAIGGTKIDNVDLELWACGYPDLGVPP